MNLTNIYKIFYPRTAEYTFFSSVQGTSSRVDHIIGHKTNLSKFDKIEIIPTIFSEHNCVKWEIDNREEQGKQICGN